MSELRNTGLQGNAGIKDTVITICLLDPARDIPTERTSEQRKIVESKIRNCHIDILRGQQELRKMKEKYTCCLNMLKMLKELPTKLANPPFNYTLADWELRWLASTESVMPGRVERCGIWSQKILQTKLDALAFEKTQWETLLAELPNDPE
jgi:hypothetical protein